MANFEQGKTYEFVSNNGVVFTAPFEDKIVLNTTVAHFELPEGENLVVEVMVDGERRYHGKAKYEEAAAIGVQRCLNGFMISEVLSNEVL